MDKGERNEPCIWHWHEQIGLMGGLCPCQSSLLKKELEEAKQKVASISGTCEECGETLEWCSGRTIGRIASEDKLKPQIAALQAKLTIAESALEKLSKGDVDAGPEHEAFYAMMDVATTVLKQLRGEG